MKLRELLKKEKVYCANCKKYVDPVELNPVLKVCPECKDKI